MELVDQIVLDLMQPTFYYATVLMVIGATCSALLLMINDMGPRVRSLLLVLPLICALAILFVFIPSLPGHGLLDSHLLSNQGRVPGGSLKDIGPPMGAAPSVESAGATPIAEMLIILGIGLGVSSLVLSTVLAHAITRRLLHVMDMGAEDFPSLRADMKDLAARMGVPEPHLGLVEDLRPNAFTFGRGKDTTVVFSLGMLTLLDDNELRAVTAHELAHIKNRDIWFKSASRSLAWAFFYNPVAHLLARAAQRERERLADQTARSALKEKDALIRALEKVSRIMALTPRPTLASRLGLRMTLSLTEHASLLSDHPSFAERVRDFHPRALYRHYPATSIVLSLGVLMVAAVLAFTISEIRVEILHFVLDPAPLQFPLMPLEHHVMGIDASSPSPFPFHPDNRVPLSGQEYERVYGKIMI